MGRFTLPRDLYYGKAIRVIKEMRENTNGEYPRWIVWENVPGAMSSSKGQDFRTVRQRTAAYNHRKKYIYFSAYHLNRPAKNPSLPLFTYCIECISPLTSSIPVSVLS